ncbi:Poly-beta-hydroxybutyrate polymerase [Sphingomonas sp. EC-HK361]|nr:Poly-beta-hydroxybutyrate polymerase [Sphingomonas sp. EC-HK361]
MPPAKHRRGHARLLDYGGSEDGPPVVFVPSLINPSHILDLTPETSLLRWIAARGHRTLLLDWGSPTPVDRALDIAGHVERILLPLLARLKQAPILVGYCLGGTMALAAAARAEVTAVATIAAPWHFTGYGETARASIADLWTSAHAACDALGLVPMEVLQSGFWRLDPARTIAKYEAFAAMPAGSRAARDFVALEDWANAGAPLTYAAGAELFAMIERDAPGRGEWIVGGAPVDLSSIACPATEFVSLGDRIVPAATAAGLPSRHDVAAGHVGMIVGGRACAVLWEPLADWLSTVAAPR